MSVFGLKDRLLTPGTTSNYGFAGSNLAKMESAKKQSNLHYKFSINGNPNVSSLHPYTLPAPSILDLNGVTPPQYIFNHPN
jgi:hypothetical protein